MKNVLFIVSMLAGVLVAPGCGSKSDSAGGGGTGGGKVLIEVIPKGTTHDFWKGMHEGADAAAKELNAEIRWIGPERESDRERQIQIVEDCISAKVSGVVLAPLDREALVPAINKLADAKIPCVIVDSDASTERRVTFAATDNYEGGVMAAKRMGKILDGKGNVLVLKYQTGSASTTARESGFMDTITKEFPGIKIVDTKFGQDTVDTALSAAEDLLTKNRDVQGFFACNETTTLGALQAMTTQARAGINFVGFDSSPTLLDALKSGKIDSVVVQNPYKMGYEGVKAVVMAINGKPVDKRIDTGVALVTLESLKDPDIKRMLRLP